MSKITVTTEVVIALESIAANLERIAWAIEALVARTPK